MKTIVFQSFRATDIPPWVDDCMESVSGWARANNWDYNLFGDEFLYYPPKEIRSKIASSKTLAEDRFRTTRSQEILLLTDLARLQTAQYYITAGGYDRAVWCDADMVVFRPDALKLDGVKDFAFCQEWWIDRNGPGFTYAAQVNNSICMFEKGNAFLPFYIDACNRIIMESVALNPLSIGTIFLTVLAGLMPVPLIKGSGILSPALMQMAVEGETSKILQTYKQLAGQPMAAANLCMSFRNKAPNGMTLTDEVYGKLVQELRTAAEKGEDLVPEKAESPKLVSAQVD